MESVVHHDEPAEADAEQEQRCACAIPLDEIDEQPHILSKIAPAVYVCAPAFGSPVAAQVETVNGAAPAGQVIAQVLEVQRTAVGAESGTSMIFATGVPEGGAAAQEWSFVPSDEVKAGASMSGFAQFYYACLRR
jgi:hypothetical protein